MFIRSEFLYFKRSVSENEVSTSKYSFILIISPLDIPSIEVSSSSNSIVLCNSFISEYL